MGKIDALNVNQSKERYLLTDNFRPLFLNLRLFNAIASTYLDNIKFADDWIRTADLWFWKLEGAEVPEANNDKISSYDDDNFITRAGALV